MSAEVVIIGGGVVGLATAWRLVERGHEVTVLDPDPGGGASFAAAGMLAPVSEYYFGEDALLHLSVPSAREYPELARALEEATGLDPGYRAGGTIVIGMDAADHARLEQFRAAQLRHSLEVEALTSREARALEPLLGPRITGAVLARDDNQVDPRALVTAYLAALDASPRAKVVRDKVAALAWDAGRTRVIGVRTASGDTPSADEIIVANGTASPDLDGLPAGLHLPIRPVMGDVLRLRAPAHLTPFLSHTVRGLVHGHMVYIVPREDGSVVIGATSREDGRDGVLAGGVYQLLRDAGELVPAVLELEFVEVVARARPGTPDNAPILGRAANGLILNTGTYRHGILLSVANARVVADLVDGLVDGRGPDIDISFFDPWRFS